MPNNPVDFFLWLLQEWWNFDSMAPTPWYWTYNA